MNKPILLTLTLSFVGFLSYCQSALKVIVRDSSDDSAVYNAIIKISGDNKPDILAYGFTEDEGEAIFSISQRPIRLEISHLTYKPLEKRIVSEEDTLLIVYLSPKNMMLDQVSITVKREVLQRGDTTVYRTDAFRSGGEGNLEDLIKKMPNFLVDAEGSVYYKNKRIEKILIEGDELTGQNYEVATRTLNPDLINEIEAIENYLDNAILKKIKKGDQTILNLKLRDNKKVSGNLELGKGINGHNSRMTILGMSNKWKNLSNLAFNNVGIKRINFNNTQEPLGSTNSWTRVVDLQKRIGLNTFFPNNLGIEQENINNEKLATTNNSFDIGKKVKLVSNFIGVHDTKCALSTSDVEVFENAVFRFSQKDSSQNFLQKLRNESKLTFNINDRNLLVVRSYWQTALNNLDNVVNLNINNRISEINQPIDYTERSLYTHTEYTNYVNKNNVLSLELRYASNKLNDEMSIKGGNYEYFSQFLKQKSRYSAAQVNWFNVTKKLDMKNSIFHSYHILNSILHIQDLNKNQEDIGVKVVSSGIETNTKWRSGKLNLGMEVNSSIQSFERYNQKKWLNKATGSASLILSQKSMLAFSVNYNETPQLDNSLHSFPIVISYRLNHQGNDSLRVNRDINYVFLYTYNDVLKQKLGASVMTMYSRKLDWYAFNNVFLQDYIQNMNIYYSPNNSLINVDLKIDKLVYFLGGTIKLKSNYTKVRTEYFRNGTVRSPHIQIFSTEFNYVSAFKSKLFAGIGGKFNLTKSDNLEIDKESIPAFWMNTYSLQLGLNLGKFIAQYEGKYIHTEKSSLQILNFFAKYKLSNKLFFSFEGRNMFNSKNYNFVNITPVQRIDNSINLIGRQLLLKLGVNF